MRSAIPAVMRWSMVAILGLHVSCIDQRPRTPQLYAAATPGLVAPTSGAAQSREAPAAPIRHAQADDPGVSREELPGEEPPVDTGQPLLPPPAAEPEQPSDAALERDVRGRLVRDPLTAGESIDVDVAAGIATLTGRVDSLAVAQAAEELAAEVPGIGFVYNSISLYPPPVAHVPPRANSDAALEERIETRLGIDPHDPTPGALRVDVEESVATITGTARSRLEQTLIISEAYAAGAVRVINRMSLVPLTIDPSGRALD